MKNIGNRKSNAYYNPDETKHPLPTNMEDSERNSELEKYIRGTYLGLPLFCALLKSALSQV